MEENKINYCVDTAEKNDGIEFKNNNTKISLYSMAGIYILAFMLIIITPFIAGIISPVFDYISYGQMRTYFTGLITSIMWTLELVIITIFCKKKWNIMILLNPKTKGKELSNKQMIILTVISIVSILFISWQIGFQVKPFYDLGNKISGYEVMGNVGQLFKNSIKCGWMVLMIRCAQKFCEEILGKGKRFIPYGGAVLMLTVGIYDLCMGLTTLPITYFLLNLVFGYIYLLTDRSVIKTYLFVLLIYFF